MNTKLQAVAPPNATRNTTLTVANPNPPSMPSVQDMSFEDRVALMAQLQQAQQADAAPLEKRKLELEAELAEVTQQIQALKPSNDSLAVYRAVRKAVKQGKKTLAAIVDASGHDQAKVEAMLNKHLKAEEGKTAIFTLKNGEYILTPKPKK